MIKIMFYTTSHHFPTILFKAILHLNKLMMVSTVHINTEYLKTLSTQAFTEVLASTLYPSLFEQVSKISIELNQLNAEDDVLLLKTMLQNITTELDDLYRKEKLVLYPFILKLEEENKKSDSCKPFKNTKAHFVNMIASLHELKKLIKLLDSEEHTEQIASLAHHVKRFEHDTIQIQQAKDKYLFAKYKNCTGCKSLE